MVRSVIIAALIVIPFITNGQPEKTSQYSPQLKYVKQSELELGLKSGLTYNLFQFDPPSVISNSSLQIDFGRGFSNRLMVKIGQNNGVAFLTEPGYQQKRSKIIIPGDTTFTLTYNMQYFSLPVYGSYQSEFQYFFGNVFQQFYVNAGLSLNILNKATRKTSLDQVDFTQSVPVTDNTYRTETSIAVALGNRFLIGQSSSFYLEIRGESGLSNINQSLSLFTVSSNNSAALPDIEINHFGISFLVGFSGSISKPEEQQEEPGKPY